ncbi:hypothetical protein Tco_1243699 [Tanacetum coccineum]
MRGGRVEKEDEKIDERDSEKRGGEREKRRARGRREIREKREQKRRDENERERDGESRLRESDWKGVRGRKSIAYWMRNGAEDFRILRVSVLIDYDGRSDIRDEEVRRRMSGWREIVVCEMG